MLLQSFDGFIMKDWFLLSQQNHASINIAVATYSSTLNAFDNLIQFSNSIKNILLTQ